MYFLGSLVAYRLHSSIDFSQHKFIEADDMAWCMQSFFLQCSLLFKVKCQCLRFLHGQLSAMPA